MSIGADESQTTNAIVKDVKEQKNGNANSAGTSLANKVAVPFDTTIEPLLKENPRRFVIFPIQYLDIWQMYKKVSFCIHFIYM